MPRSIRKANKGVCRYPRPCLLQRQAFILILFSIRYFPRFFFVNSQRESVIQVLIKTLKNLSISCFPNIPHNIWKNSQALLICSVILPFPVKKAVTELKSKISKNKLLVSVAAGIKLKDLQEWSGQDRFIRVMPNTQAAVGATEEDGAIVSKLFGSVGKILRADEKLFDAVTGLSGSGPAYIFLAIEALADGGEAAGLPRELALDLASQTVLGAATMVSKTGKHPGVLKDDVTSPGGTRLEKGSFRATLMNAVVAAANRSRELSQS